MVSDIGTINSITTKLRKNLLSAYIYVKSMIKYIILFD